MWQTLTVAAALVSVAGACHATLKEPQANRRRSHFMRQVAALQKNFPVMSGDVRRRSGQGWGDVTKGSLGGVGQDSPDGDRRRQREQSVSLVAAELQAPTTGYLRSSQNSSPKVSHPASFGATQLFNSYNEYQHRSEYLEPAASNKPSSQSAGYHSQIEQPRHKEEIDEHMRKVTNLDYQTIAEMDSQESSDYGGGPDFVTTTVGSPSRKKEILLLKAKTSKQLQLPNDELLMYQAVQSTVHPSTSIKKTQTLTSQQIMNILRHASLGKAQGGKNSVLSKRIPIPIIEIPTRMAAKAENVRRKAPEVRSKRPQKTRAKHRRPSLFNSFLESLRSLPVLGNMLRATVDPMYRPILNSIMPLAESRDSTDGDNEIACFDALGCIATPEEFYDPIIRPINMPPYDRKSINTHYTLYTRAYPSGLSLSPNQIHLLSNSPFNVNRKTKFIIHGFLDDQNSTWIKDMTRAFLKHGDYNVFTVDWSDGSRVMYHQAVSNIRVVALEVAALINWLIKNMSHRAEMVHVVGHSLGAHTAGYVGERVVGLGRITGLDPAEPFFQYLPASVRLDPTDANFVDVIHSDTKSLITAAWEFGGYGLDQAVGHVDFYPNGGRQQPGCSSLSRIPLTVLQEGSGISEGIDAAQKEAVACNHIRANKLFTASLLGSCAFQSFPCSSYRKFEKAECFSCDESTGGCANLGIDAEKWSPQGKNNVRMYLTTSDGPHFCQYHYRLTLDLGDERGRGGSLRGRLLVTVITEAGELKEFDLSESSALVLPRGTQRTFLLRHGEDLSASRDILMRWTYEADVFSLVDNLCAIFCPTDLQVSTVTLTPLDTPGLKGDSRDDIVMCHKQGDAVVHINSETTIKISAEPFCASGNHTQTSALLIH